MEKTNPEPIFKPCRCGKKPFTYVSLTKRSFHAFCDNDQCGLLQGKVGAFGDTMHLVAIAWNNLIASQL